MKRYLIAILVLAVILSVILVNVSLMDTIAADFRERLEAIETLVRADDWEGAKAGMEAFAEEWDKKKTYLMALLDHQTIDKINLPLERIQGYLEYNDKPPFVAECRVLVETFSDIREGQKISLVNIF